MSRKNLSEAVKGPEKAVIGEVKLRLPSGERLGNGAEVADRLRLYSEYFQGVSVVIEEKLFGGSLELLEKVRELTELPILAKDFFDCEEKIRAAKGHGADAILLVAERENANRLRSLVAYAHSLGLECLIEFNGVKEMGKVFACELDLVGVNSRNLATMEVDVEKAKRLAAKVKGEIPLVFESGIDSREQIDSLPARVDAVLVGTSLMKARDLAAKCRELSGR